MYGDNPRQIDCFLHFINRVVEPLSYLKDEKQAQEFLDISRQWVGDMTGPIFKKTPAAMVPEIELYSKYRLKTRVVCFFYGKADYKEEIRFLRMAARTLSPRSSLRVGIITDPKVIKRLRKSKGGAKYFPEVGLSSCALRRYDGEYSVLDLSAATEKLNFQRWINLKSKKALDTLDHETLEVQSNLGMSMFLVFVDGSVKSQKAIEEIQKIQPKYGHILGFYIAHNDDWSHTKRLLGITWEDLPAMAFNMLDKTAIPYPQDKQIDADILFPWFDAILTGQDSESVKQDNFQRTIQDHDIEKLLRATTKTDRSNFTHYTLEEGYETIAFLYTTEVENPDQRADAKEFNAFADMVLNPELLNLGKKVRIASYDTNANAFPDGIEFTQSFPQIYYFPSFSKSTPFERYLGQIETA